MFSNLFGGTLKPPNMPFNTVTFDDLGFKRLLSDGRVEEITWDELSEVCIVTTDQGAALDDVFYVLTGNGKGCAVPSEAVGVKELLPRLMSLPNFNHQVALQSVTCATNAKFVCWQRGN